MLPEHGELGYRVPQPFKDTRQTSKAPSQFEAGSALDPWLHQSITAPATSGGGT